MKNLFSKSLSRKRLAITFASFVVLAATLGFSYYEGSKYTVALTLNGQQKVMKTHANTVKDVLAQLDIPVNSKDYLSPSADARVKDNQKIVFKQARQVHIVQDHEKKTIWTTAGTVEELLKEQKIVLNEQDEISSRPQETIKNKMEISIKSALHLTLVDGGNEQQVWSTSATVADFLTQQGIKLNKFDRVEPSLSETVKKDDVINVIRVEKVTDVVEEPVQFAVITKKDESLEKGKETTVKEGRLGVISKEYEVILENGKEVSRKLIAEQSLREKLDKVVAVGTKELEFQVSRGAETGTEFYVNTTAYTAYCNGCSGRTASGLDLRANPNAKVIAVDPRVIPLGTKVYVEGYGYAIAADTGGAIKGHKIDVFFPTKTEAFRWGVRKVKIKILE
ncbi:G5 and 3D domain-containing protein [Bacillus sp. OK048]|uniref:G5 and 3D domain-containing protein n=1 Tax=Bacillus sp. OK048 TaxID=1882761 RepID=UPI000B850F64|nr:G5 and 3D domain-containing protein [Bacillus sp. OK048]